MASEALIEQWVRTAMATAVVDEEGDGEITVIIPVLRGPWGYGNSFEVAAADLESYLPEWIALKLADGDDDIPVMGGVDIYASHSA